MVELLPLDREAWVQPRCSLVKSPRASHSYYGIDQGCTTYLKRWATRKCRTKAEGHNGGLGTVPPVGSRGNAPGQGVRGAKLTTCH